MFQQVFRNIYYTSLHTLTGERMEEQTTVDRCLSHHPMHEQHAGISQHRQEHNTTPSVYENIVLINLLPKAELGHS